MTVKPIRLSDLVRVGSRFGRSVNLERDFYQLVNLDGYVLTSTAHAILDRLAQSLTDTSGPHAWTLTGPYGTGKSAFALFAAKILSDDTSEATEAARTTLRLEDEPLWQTLFDHRRSTALRHRGFCPVLVSGSREPINRALLRGLERSIRHFWPASHRLLLGEIKSLLDAVEAGEAIHGRQVAEIFEMAAQKVCSSSNPGNGLLVIVDELGKLLEYAAGHSDESDIFVLQELAERSRRSTDHCILLVTILHQAFDRYFENLGRAQKEEWMKVQGRFEDVAFQEPVEQVLRILAQAIEHHGPQRAIQVLRQHGRESAQRATEIQLVPNWVKKKDALELLVSCVPLHPTVSLALGHLFRRLGQNERSLFAFLTSHEPHGFQEFLAGTEWQQQRANTFRVDQLYDYITAALGSGLYAHGSGKKWSEIESALDRLANPTELEVRVVKTIGLLNAIGDIGHLKPTKELLRFALADEKTKPSDIDRALQKLQDRSLVIYRRYRDGYSLWEGSDVDIEARLAEAHTRLDVKEPLTHGLTKYFKPAPIVARRHSLQTGTLRFFEVRYVDIDGFDQVLAQPLGDADGLVLCALALSRGQIRNLIEKAEDSVMSSLPQVLIAIPLEIAGMEEALIEVACLKWVLDNTPELEGDPTARRELQARLTNAEASVERWLLSVFDSSHEASAQNSSKGCAWYRKGAEIGIRSRLALQEHISEVCDEVFNKAPLLRNELINRRQLSSAASSARRELIAAMIAQGEERALGIEGFPPHLSMYFSLLEKTGIHREEAGRWGFFPPKPDADSGVIAVWKAVDDFFAATEVQRCSIAELFNLLALPPYGIKSGPLPVLLCAALLHYDTEIAVYEQGSFIPSLSTDVFERLMKSPDKFQVQRCRIAGVRAVVFERFANALLQKPERAFAEKPNLLAVVRPLTRFAARLPDYTRNTQRLSGIALRVRDALFSAREPDHLLFVQLPEACGFEPFVSDDTRELKGVDDLFKNLRASLSELQRAYDDLLGDLEVLLIAAFSLRNKGADARSELVARAQALLDFTVEPKLKSFIIRATDDGLDLVGWIESIATFLASKPPASWNDMDLARFEVGLADVARSFLHIELLSFELSRHRPSSRSDIEVIRLGITTANEPEREKVLTIGQQDLSLIDAAGCSIEEVLKTAGLDGNIELRLAVLTKLSQKLLDRLDESYKERRHVRMVKAKHSKGILGESDN